MGALDNFKAELALQLLREYRKFRSSMLSDSGHSFTNRCGRELEKSKSEIGDSRVGGRSAIARRIGGWSRGWRIAGTRRVRGGFCRSWRPRLRDRRGGAGSRWKGRICRKRG